MSVIARPLMSEERKRKATVLAVVSMTCLGAAYLTGSSLLAALGTATTFGWIHYMNPEKASRKPEDKTNADA